MHSIAACPHTAKVSPTCFTSYISCSECGSPKCAGAPCGTSDAFWSGYYTSKPAQKLLARSQAASLRATELLYALAPQAHADTTVQEQWWATILVRAH